MHLLPVKNRIPTLAIVVILLIIVFAVVAFLLVRKNIPELPVPKEEVTKQVATDPNFAEVKGQLLPGFPEFPIYPGAELVGSAEVNLPDEPNQGYRVKWTTYDPVPQVMDWYLEELSKTGWVVEEPNDPEAEGEQVANIHKGGFKGHIAVESEGSEGEGGLIFLDRVERTLKEQGFGPEDFGNNYPNISMDIKLVVAIAFLYDITLEKAKEFGINLEMPRYKIGSDGSLQTIPVAEHLENLLNIWKKLIDDNRTGSPL